MRVNHSRFAFLLLFSLFSIHVALGAQESAWDRSIDNGDVAMAKQHYAEAETAYRQAVTIAEKRWKKDARISASLFKVAESCNAQGKREEADTLAKRSSASMDEAVNAHPARNASDVYQELTVSTALFEKVGDLLAGNQDYPDAEGMYQKSLTRWREYVSRPTAAERGNEELFRFWLQAQQDAPSKLVSAGVKLGALYQKQAKLKEAGALYRQLATTQKLDETNEVREVPLLTSLASAEFRIGDYVGAEPLFKHVIDLLASSKYKDSPDMASALENYAVLLRKTGREDASKPFLDRASVIRANSATVVH